MTPVDPQARLLLECWAATPGAPVDQLTPAAVRREDLALREPQAAPARLHAVDDVEVPGPGGALDGAGVPPAAGSAADHPVSTRRRLRDRPRWATTRRFASSPRRPAA
jgi:hypothetical protein